MDFIGAILGIAFSFLAVGSLGLIALFVSCDAAAEEEKKQDLKKKKTDENHLSRPRSRNVQSKSPRL